GSNNAYLSIRKFAPSHPDLPSILVTTDNGVHIAIKDTNGNPVGYETVQNPLDNDSNPSQKSGPSTIQYYVQKPATGDYFITFSTANQNQNYHTTIYSYDVNAKVKLLSHNGTLTPTQSDTFKLHFDKDNLKKVQDEQVITLADLRNDINTAYAQGKIKKAFRGVLLVEVAAVEKQISKNNNKAAKLLLDAMQIELLLSIKNVGTATFTLLNSDIQY